MNSPRIITRAYYDIDIYSAFMADMEYINKNGKRPPPSLSKVTHVQKLLNDNMRYNMVHFIQKKFGVNVPDGTPTSIAPATDRNTSTVDLSTVTASIAQVTISPAYESDLHFLGSLEVDVTAGIQGGAYVSGVTIGSSTVTIPALTIPEVQHISIDGNGDVTIDSTTPAQTIAAQTITVPTISKQTDNLITGITVSLALHINGVSVVAYQQICEIGHNVIPFSFALPKRAAGDYTAALKASINGGAASVAANGVLLQGWANAILTADSTTEE